MDNEKLRQEAQNIEENHGWHQFHYLKDAMGRINKAKLTDLQEAEARDSIYKIANLSWMYQNKVIDDYNKIEDRKKAKLDVEFEREKIKQELIEKRRKEKSESENNPYEEKAYENEKERAKALLTNLLKK